MSEVSAAYATLFNYAQRSKAYSPGLPETEEIKEYWSGIGFSLDGRNYVTPINETAEILQIPPYTTVPGVKKWVKGVANVRGKLLPVLDLIGFFNRNTQTAARKRRLLVIQTNALYSGIIVDQVFGMQHFEVNDFTSNTQSDDPAASYVKGNYSRDGEIWHVFSPHTLAEDSRFIEVAM